MNTQPTTPLAASATPTHSCPRRVLLLSHEGPVDARGGLGVVVGELLREFTSLGAEVTLVTGEDSHLPQSLREPALDPYALPRPAERDRALSGFTQRALAAAETTKPHVLHAHDWVAVDAGLHVREALGIRLVAHVHSTEWDRSLGRVDPWIVAREGAGLRSADRVLCVSERTRRLICRGYGVPKEKTRVLHPGLPEDANASAQASHLSAEVSAALPSTPSESPRVLFLGRLVPQKGLDLFLRIAQLIQRELPLARFVVAGDGPSFEDGLEYALERKLSRQVRFTGHLSRTDVKILMDRCDVLLMPSLAEPFGLVALEAARAGLPVVASNTCGFIEALPAFRDFAPADSQGAAAAVLLALGAPEEVQTWRERSRKSLDRLDSRFAATEVLAEVLGEESKSHLSHSEKRLAPLL